MTLLTRIKTETILLESDIKELIDILISPSIGTDIKYELLSLIRSEKSNNKN